MSSFYKFLIIIGLFCFSAFTYAEINNDNQPTSYVGTFLKGNYSNSITPFSAFSILGEFGPRNIRLNGTLGGLLSEAQLVKISAEFLRQDINYAFFSGQSREWVKQGAVGALYQYNFYQYSYLPQFTLQGGYSSAASKALSTIVEKFQSTSSLTSYVANYRRIAGSDAGYLSPGISIASWGKARAGIELNYDYVHYRRYFLKNNNAIGFGGTVNLNQPITDTLDTDLSAGIRQPFNVYKGRLSYNPTGLRNWKFSTDVNYVDGKHLLPNTYSVGISVSYVPTAPSTIQPLLKEPLEREPNLLPRWVSTPAIYIPQVLAVPDERVTIVSQSATPTPSCNLPVVVGTVPDVLIEAPDTVDIQTAFAFNSDTNVTYSMVTSDPGENTITINPATGVINIIAPGFVVAERIVNITVTATNLCGPVSTSFVVTIQSD